MNMHVNKKLKFGNNIATVITMQRINPTGLFSQAYIAAPIFNPYNPDGQFGNTNKSDVGNPIATLKTTNNRSWGNRLQFSLWGDYKILKDLSVSAPHLVLTSKRMNGWNYVPVYIPIPRQWRGWRDKKMKEAVFILDVIVFITGPGITFSPTIQNLVQIINLNSLPVIPQKEEMDGAIVLRHLMLPLIRMSGSGILQIPPVGSKISGYLLEVIFAGNLSSSGPIIH